MPAMSIDSEKWEHHSLMTVSVSSSVKSLLWFLVEDGLQLELSILSHQAMESQQQEIKVLLTDC